MMPGADFYERINNFDIAAVEGQARNCPAS
jgi:hypothetical protein